MSSAVQNELLKRSPDVFCEDLSIKQDIGKSVRNKTIDFTLSEGKKYLERCIKSVNEQMDLSTILDKTIIGDSESILKLLPTHCVDLAIIDPPYNLTKNYHGNVFSRSSEGSYYEFTESWLKNLIPLLKSTASIYVCCDWRTSITIYNVLSKYLNIQNRITWQREKGRGAKNNWKNSMEDIWFATVSPKYNFNVDAVKVRKKVIAPYREKGVPKDWMETSSGNYRDTHPSNFWDDITIPYWSMPENTAHPTQKPEKLIAKLILASSHESDIVLDPFLGSGTTSVVAKKLGRHYIGIEQSSLYCAWAEKRLETASFDQSIQGYSNGVFWERNTLNAQKKSS